MREGTAVVRSMRPERSQLGHRGLAYYLAEIAPGIGGNWRPDLFGGGGFDHFLETSAEIAQIRCLLPIGLDP